jgi:peptidoglycan/LPS O-acetylase OafA/YrhL
MYVVFFHYFPLPAVGTPFARCLNHGYLAVDLFFVLSGFVMTMTYQHFFEPGWSPAAYLRFLGRRIARIYPLYIAATLAGFVLVIVGWQTHYQPTAPLGWDLFFNLTMIQSWGLAESFDSPAWSLSAEWAAYLLFPLLLVPAMFRKPPAAWLSALLCVLTLAALAAFPSQDWNKSEPLNISDHHFGLPVIRCVAEFVLGILAFRVAVTPFGRSFASNRRIAALVCLAVVGTAALPKSDLAIVLLFPVLVVVLTSEAHLPGRILASPPIEFLGRLSYSIYLVHKLLFLLLNWIDANGHAYGLSHARLYGAVICLALTFAIAFTAYRTIEVPGRRRLRELFEGAHPKTLRAARRSTS